MKVSDTGDIGIIARQRRQEMRISQAELSARAGITRQWLHRFERGNSEVSLSKVFAVLRELDLKVRIEAIEDVAVAAKVVQYEIPRIGIPPISPNINMADLIPKVNMSDIVTKNAVDNIVRSIGPLSDPTALAQMKDRIKAIEAVKPNDDDE